MNHIERFKAIVNGKKPDYYPVFGFPGAPGVSGGCMRKTHERLVETGMPEWIDGSSELGKPFSNELWQKYWGTTGIILDRTMPAEPPKGFKSERRLEGEYEIIETECGSITRQVIDNDVTYSMPEYIQYPIRDRDSFEFYRERMTPGEIWKEDKLDELKDEYKDRDQPLGVSLSGTWGPNLRSLMGPARAATIFYDDPELAEDILNWAYSIRRKYIFPVVEKLRPEVLYCGEDICYKQGMFISPQQFNQYCASYYRELAELKADCGADMIVIDTDGNAMQFTGVAESCGVNAICPYEVKAGNNLVALREMHPEFVFFGWLEKEVLNEGNGHLIEKEIMTKVPKLLEKGRYFPNADHGIQPLVTFENMCKFMTLLHEVLGNPEGEYPKMKP